MRGSCASASPTSEANAALPSRSSGAFARREFSGLSVGWAHDGSVLASDFDPVLLHANNDPARSKLRIGQLESPTHTHGCLAPSPKEFAGGSAIIALGLSASQMPPSPQVTLRAPSREGPNQRSSDPVLRLGGLLLTSTSAVAVSQISRSPRSSTALTPASSHATLVALKRASVGGNG
ncbi:hypothetical protein C8R47DRAFT_1171626 [Mycena vitilis]|nr:hypothetical protein C8R47DRAFT_1171626 [Mycena vitilis]